MSRTMTATGNGAHDAEAEHDQTPIVVEKENTSHAPKEAAELLRSDAGDLTAETVTMDRSGAETIKADRVTMDRSGARKLEAKSAHLENSGAVRMTAENAVFYGGAAVLVQADQIRIVDSNFVAIKAAEQTTIDGNVKTVIYAGPADEKIKPVFTVASAVSFGAGFAVTLMVFGRVMRRLVRRG